MSLSPSSSLSSDWSPPRAMGQRADLYTCPWITGQVKSRSLPRALFPYHLLPHHRMHESVLTFAILYFEYVLLDLQVEGVLRRTQVIKGSVASVELDFIWLASFSRFSSSVASVGFDLFLPRSFLNLPSEPSKSWPFDQFAVFSRFFSRRERGGEGEGDVQSLDFAPFRLYDWYLMDG